MGEPASVATMCPVWPMLDVFTKMYPSPGSNDTPAQLAPPMALGNARRGSRPKGVKGPRVLYFANCAAQYSWISGEMLETSSAVILSRASGGGFSGNGWVGHDASPGTSLFGTGRSSTPQTGFPVSR